MTTFETNALEINDLNKNYPGFSLNHLNLTLPSGCILGLIGENGAGKTTTIKLILDIIKKDSGSIRILGRDCTSATTILKEEIGVVLDEVGFQECLTPLQIGRIMKDIFHNWDPSLYDQYLQKFNLPNKKEFGKFSKGMKMKLGIAVALSHHPNIAHQPAVEDLFLVTLLRILPESHRYQSCTKDLFFGFHNLHCK